MKLFRKKPKVIYCVVAFHVKPRFGTRIDHQPIIIGIFSNKKQAETYKLNQETDKYHEYIVIQEIPSDL